MSTNFSRIPNIDFIGFSFGKWHSIRDGHIYRTSDGSRYNQNLAPSFQDKTLDLPGRDGQMFFDTLHKNRTFSINFAFDELSETDLRNLYQVFNGKEIKNLIFDEQPYKAYDAKVTGTPTIKILCFDDTEDRVYKGEGTIQFTCYNPYAHTPTWVWRDNGTSIEAVNADGRLSSSYQESVYTSKAQWISASGLTDSVGVNKGDVPAPFVVSGVSGSVTVAGNSITILEGSGTWDSKMGVVYKIENLSKVPLPYTGNACATIGPNETASANKGSLSYSYWYY